MKLVVRVPGTELEQLDDWAARFHLVPNDGEHVAEFYEAEMDRADLDALCAGMDYTCDVGDDGVGEVRDDDRVVARVRTWGRIA